MIRTKSKTGDEYQKNPSGAGKGRFYETGRQAARLFLYRHSGNCAGNDYVFVAYKVIVFIDVSVNRLLPPQFKPDNFLPFTIPGLGIIILVAALILVGMFAAGFLGKFFLKLGEWIVYKVPFISSVYSLLKQIFETFLSGKSNAFKKVVLLEYPRKGIWILGFVSADTEGEVREILGREMVNVFIPTTPNPTSGFLILCRAKMWLNLIWGLKKASSLSFPAALWRLTRPSA